jgi:hypothetical protein
MSDPVSALFLALDRGVERISDRAFDSAVSDQRAEAEEAPTAQERLLERVKNHKASLETPGVREAIHAGLVEQDPAGELVPTEIGEYLLPEPDDAPADEEQPVQERAPAQAGT